MNSSFPLSENSPLGKIVIALKLLLSPPTKYGEIDFIWIVKSEVTRMYGNILYFKVETYFCDPKRTTLL